jgi:hypothetical protein
VRGQFNDGEARGAWRWRLAASAAAEEEGFALPGYGGS